MSVAKIVEITAESPESFDAAIKEAIARTSKTVKDIQAAWVKGQQVVVKDGKITAYYVDLKITFLVHD